ncbi:MAG: regulatory protein RecX [Gemmatimonadota bacterium]
MKAMIKSSAIRNRRSMADPGAAPSGTVTSIDPDSRGAGAVKVNVNGRWFCTIPQASVAVLDLHPGLPMNESLHEGLGRAADAQAAYRFILAALGRRGFARRDMERRLVQKGHPREAAQAAVARATAAGLLDDLAFARSYAELKSANGRGPARLMRDLFTMGIDRGIAEEVVGQTWNEGDTLLDTSRALAKRRAAQLGALPGPVKRRRVLAYLARRGFSGHEVRKIVNTVVV